MRRKRHFWLLIVTVLSLVGLGFLIVSYPPSFRILIIKFGIPILTPALILLFLLIFSLTAFILNNSRRGILLGLLVVSYLILRLNGLTSPFFAILLLILLGTIELFFVKRK